MAKNASLETETFQIQKDPFAFFRYDRDFYICLTVFLCVSAIPVLVFIIVQLIR